MSDQNSFSATSEMSLGQIAALLSMDIPAGADASLEIRNVKALDEAAAGDADEVLAEELAEDVSGEELLEAALNGETDGPEPEEPDAPEVDEPVEPDVPEEDAVEAEPEQPEAEEKKDEKPAEPAGDGGARLCCAADRWICPCPSCPRRLDGTAVRPPGGASCRLSLLSW